MANHILEAELIERLSFNVDISETELIEVNLNSLEIVTKPRLDDLNDVDTTGVADGTALVYDSASGKWKPTVIIGADYTVFVKNSSVSELTSTRFQTPHTYRSGTLEVYRNGLKELASGVTEDTNQTFILSDAKDSNDTIEVSYIKA